MGDIITSQRYFRPRWNTLHCYYRKFNWAGPG